MKGMEVVNTLAYYDTSAFTAVKSLKYRSLKDFLTTNMRKG
jgi:hypothetical protein